MGMRVTEQLLEFAAHFLSCAVVAMSVRRVHMHARVCVCVCCVWRVVRPSGGLSAALAGSGAGPSTRSGGQGLREPLLQGAGSGTAPQRPPRDRTHRGGQRQSNAQRIAQQVSSLLCAHTMCQMFCTTAHGCLHVPWVHAVLEVAQPAQP